MPLHVRAQHSRWQFGGVPPGVHAREAEVDSNFRHVRSVPYCMKMFLSAGLPVSSGIHSFVDLVRNNLDLDILVIVNIWILVTGFITSIRLAGNILHSCAEKTCLSTVHVKQDDPLYEEIVLWMNDHAFRRRNFRSVLAQTTKNSDDTAITRSSPEKLDADRLISYREVDDNSSVELKPFHGSRLFRFKRKWILFSHAANSHENISRYPQIEVRPQLKLQCLSLSLSPIKNFLDEVRAYSRKVSVSNITVYRTRTNSRDIIRWSSVASRPSRDITTVILDKYKKKTILRDINEYLHPHTRQWYANHGIPYRRGYLFSGPPGTGKTSLASAIAGVFGLDIYVLSLLDPTVTESQFIRLFSEVPTRCVVLLEDIDAAGLNRGNMMPGQDLTKSRSAAVQYSLEATTAPASATVVSLSGLLNAIDGISSHEGRILIMTTNAPQNLDRALIRPGRVDLHIQFELPSHEELRSLFLNMYSDVSQNPAAPAKEEKREPASLDNLAIRFAGLLPERRFSLAEVQGFLLQHKRRPEEACENVSSWIKEMEQGDLTS
jgi:chaperone BCS1